MSSTYIKQVMESMGWTDGSYIPIANADNREIMNNINRLIKDKSEKSTTLQNTAERAENLGSHLKNTEQDINQNLNLLCAHRSQITSETHMYKLADHENSRTKQQIKELEAEHDSLKNYENNTTREMNKMRKNVEKLTDKINWAKMALMEWRQAMSEGEETNQLIEKYCKEDQNRAEALETRRRIIQDSINKQRKLLIDSYEEQKSLEQTLERTAQLYRQAHGERRQLVTTWKEAVSQMNQREKSISLTEEELEEAKELSMEKSQELKDHTEFLNQQITNNEEIQQEIKELNENASNLRNRLTELLESFTMKDNEVSALRKILQGVTQKLQQQRQRNRQIVREQTEKGDQINRIESEFESLQKRYEKFQNRNMNAHERLNQLEELLETEEKTKEQLNLEIGRLNGIFFRSQQQLNKMKDDDKLISIQNKGIEMSINNLRNVIRDNEKEQLRQTEIAYNLAFKAQQLEARIANMKGQNEDIDPDKEERLMHLEEEYKSKQKQKTLCESQISKVEDDLRRLTHCYTTDTAEVAKMNDKIKERQLFCEGGEKSLKSTTMANQEKIVELSIIKMRKHQMEKQIAKHEDKAYTLEKHRIELETAMKERLIHIKTQMDLLFMKRKHLQDERGTLKLDLGERIIKIEALKKRYELAVELLGRNEDGSLISATQLKIATAQEKQMLLQEGNELNEKVLKAEDDIKAMENTLCLLNYSNDSYRRTFEKLDEKNPELVELNTLMEAYCKLVNRLKNARSHLTTRAKELEDMADKRDSLDNELDEISRNRMDINEVLMKIHKELMDQKTKIQRAERELKAGRKAAQQRCLDYDYLTLFEKELDIKEMEEKNTTSLQLIADLVDSNPELGPNVSKLLYERGIKIPQVSHQRSHTSWRSEFSERTGSESSLRIFSASSKGSACSSISSKLAKATLGSGIQSVVSIDFPGDDSVKSHPSTRKSSGKSSAGKSK